MCVWSWSTCTRTSSYASTYDSSEATSPRLTTALEYAVLSLLSVSAVTCRSSTVSAGAMNEKNGIATLYDVLAALGSTTTSATIYAVISPLESLLTGYKRVVVKDSAVNAVCYGAKLMLPGLLRYESGMALMSGLHSALSSLPFKDAAVSYVWALRAILGSWPSSGLSSLATSVWL